MTAPPSKKPRVVRGSERVRESARVAGWAVGLSGLVSLVGALLAQHRAGSLAVQTFAAEWGAGQLGVAWSDPEAPVPSNAGKPIDNIDIGIGKCLTYFERRVEFFQRIPRQNVISH